MYLSIPIWNEIEVDKLTLEIIDDEGKMFLKLYTNDVNIFNKKIIIDDKEDIKEKILDILSKMEEIGSLYLLEEFDKFKQKSSELLDEIKIL